MGIRAATGVFFAWLALPGIGGDLEDGIRFHERKDYRRAVVAFQNAAANGSPEAQRRLGFMYYHGEGVAQDNRRALALFGKAAEAGDTESALNLGKMHEYGLGVGQDDPQAAAWYRTGAEQGDPWAQFEVSVMYYKGQGVARDRIEAAKWWTLAMANGGAIAERIRQSVESAESKLTAQESAEGKARAVQWQKARQAGK